MLFRIIGIKKVRDVQARRRKNAPSSIYRNQATPPAFAHDPSFAKLTSNASTASSLMERPSPPARNA